MEGHGQGTLVHNCEGATLHSVGMSPQSPVVCDSFSAFLSFS